VEEAMRKTAWAVMAALLLLALSGLAGEDPRVGPPPLRTEAPTLQPSQNHVWAQGYWKWSGVNYEWVDGRWIKAKKNREWVPGTWGQVGNRWVWKRAAWKKIETPESLAKKAKKAAKKAEKDK
jgi:hypothetical protein